MTTLPPLDVFEIQGPLYGSVQELKLESGAKCFTFRLLRNRDFARVAQW
jgi:hypothetical protein